MWLIHQIDLQISFATNPDLLQAFWFKEPLFSCLGLDRIEKKGMNLMHLGLCHEFHTIVFLWKFGLKLLFFFVDNFSYGNLGMIPFLVTWITWILCITKAWLSLENLH